MLKNIKFDGTKKVTDGITFKRRMKDILEAKSYADIYIELTEREIDKGAEGYIELNNLINKKLEAKGVDLEDDDARDEVRNGILVNDDLMRELIIKEFDHEYGIKFKVDELIEKIEEIKDDEYYVDELEELVEELKKYNNPKIEELK